MSLQFKPATREAEYPIPAWVYEHRLLNRVEVDEAGCWLWQGSVASHGYGCIRAWKKGLLVHRLAFELMVEPIQGDNQIDHLCRVRTCINPEHLEQVTQAENLRRQGEAVTHCPNRHEYTEANTYRSSSRGERRCRECARTRNRAASRARRES